MFSLIHRKRFLGAGVLLSITFVWWLWNVFSKAGVESFSEWRSLAMEVVPSKGEVFQRLKPDRVLQAGEKRDAGDERIAVRRWLLETDAKYGRVIFQEDSLPSGGMRQVAYAANHVLVRAGKGEGDAVFRSRMDVAGFEIAGSLGRSGVYRIAVEGEDLEAVDRTIEKLKKANGSSGHAEPDYMVFTCQSGTPQIAVSPAGFNLEMIAGTEGADSITINNAGTGVLKWRIANVDINAPLPNPVANNDTYFSYLWNLRDPDEAGITATRAWSITTGSASVIIAVVDTGVDYNHLDLQSNIWVNTGEIANNQIDDDENGYVDDVRGWDFYSNDANPMDEHGHGTHVAGTIAARGNNNRGVVGVTWNSRILPIKFLDANGAGYVSDAIGAVAYAWASGARVINASWGGEGDSVLLKEEIEAYCEESDSLFITAAGNSAVNIDVTPQYPAAYTHEGIVTVAATDESSDLAYFSNYGVNGVDLAAPGSNIVSTYINNQYAYSSGTSMAAPHVSGVAALLLAQNPGIVAADLKAHLLYWTDYLPVLNGKVATAGCLNAYRSLKRLSGSWLRPAALNGSVSASQNQILNFDFLATNLDPGVYTGEISFISNDAANPEIALPVHLEVIPSNPYNDWKSEIFGENNLFQENGEGNVWEDEADPDGDGQENIMEYVFGSSPTDAQSNRDLSIEDAGGEGMEIRFQTRTDLSAIDWHVEWIDDLGSTLWRQDGIVLEVVGSNAETGMTDWRVKFVAGFDIPSKAFFRLSARPAQP